MIFKPFPTLVTERLSLTPMTNSDIPQIFFLRSDAVVNKYVKRETPATIDDALAWLKKVEAKIENDETVNWAIRLKEQDEMIGSICLWNFSEDRKTAEIGYDLHPDYHGKGIMSQSMDAVTSYGRQTLGLDAILAFTQNNNDASRQLLVSKGFEVDLNQHDSENDANMVYALSF